MRSTLVKPQPFGYKGSKSHGFPNQFRFVFFGNQFRLEMTKNNSIVKAETSA